MMIIYPYEATPTIIFTEDGEYINHPSEATPTIIFTEEGEHIHLYETTPTIIITEEGEHISVRNHAYNNTYRGRWTYICTKPRLQ